jgi:hypothetical protein
MIACRSLADRLPIACPLDRLPHAHLHTQVAKREEAVFGLGLASGAKGVVGMQSERNALAERIQQEDLIDSVHAAAIAQSVAPMESQRLLVTRRASLTLDKPPPFLALAKKKLQPATPPPLAVVDPPDDDVSIVGVLRLRARDLLSAPAHKTWYRLEDEVGSTAMLLALRIKSWDPMPRKLAKERKQKSADDDSDSDNVSEESLDSDDEEVMRQRTIGGQLSRLTTEFWVEGEDRRQVFKDLLKKLGASPNCRAELLGTAKVEKGAAGAVKKQPTSLMGAVFGSRVAAIMPAGAPSAALDPEACQTRVSQSAGCWDVM